LVLTDLIGGALILVAVIAILVRNTADLRRIFLPLSYVLLILSFLCLILAILNSKIQILVFAGSLWTYIGFAFVLIHSSIVLSKKRTMILFIISMVIGLFFELVGVKYGWLFGTYHYNLNASSSPFIFGLVPYLTVVSWAVIIYMSYSITNIFLTGFKFRKTDLNKLKPVHLIPFIILLSVIDGLIATNLDMILDPVTISQQIPGWFWTFGGTYFGIPISNFIGWFTVTFIATVIFRFFETLKPLNAPSSHLSSFVPASIVGLYLMFFIVYAFKALSLGATQYILIGAATMGPFILVSTLIILFNHLSRRKADEY
jgi:uncharacterized membrane protein